MKSRESRGVSWSIYIHILPHLDDGAFDLETSVRMADLAARSGCFIWLRPVTGIIMIIR